MFISDMITACSDNVEKKKGIIDVQLQDKRTNGLSGLCLTNGSTLVAILIGRMRFIQQTIQFFFSEPKIFSYVFDDTLDDPLPFQRSIRPFQRLYL